jgi:hypothetical protein
LRSEARFWRNAETDDLGDNDDQLFFKELGADCFTINNAGTSLLHVVAGRKIENHSFLCNKELKAPMENLVRWFKFLMDMGLEPMLEDAQQRTSLDAAASCGNEHILKLFKQKPMEYD